MAKSSFDLAGYVPTQDQLAKLIGISPRTVRNRIGVGDLAPMGSTLAEHLTLWCGADPKHAAAAQRARLVSAQADIAELKLSKLRAEVVEVEFVEAAVIAVLTEVRAAFIALAASLSPEIAHLTNPTQATELLQARIYAAMMSIAESNFDRIIEDALRRAAASAQDDDAAAEADAQPMD